MRKLLVLLGVLILLGVAVGCASQAIAQTSESEGETLSPTTQLLSYRPNDQAVAVDLPATVSLAEATKLIFIKGSVDPSYSPSQGNVILWNGHEFEIAWATIYPQYGKWVVGLGEATPHEIITTLYWPIDQSTNQTDWHGAIGAKPNSTGDAWVPYHADAGTHHDLGLSFEDAVYTVFKPELDGTQSDINNLDPRDAPHGRKVREYTALVQAQAKVLEKVVATDKARFLGYYEQNPHPEVGHVLTAVKDAIAEVKAENASLWRKAPLSLGRIEAGVNTRAAREVETRWEQEARIAAEKKAAAAGD